MDILYLWNRWYDDLPEPWPWALVLGLLVVVGWINMAVTIASGFPFGLLVLIAMIILAALRLPYERGWAKPPVKAKVEVES